MLHWALFALLATGLGFKRASWSRRTGPLFATQQLTSDGGVVKDVLLPGTGKRVEAGDILAVEYVARVGSRVIAKGEKEKFVLKDGSLIKGWDIGVGSMQVGEKARILCKPSYAYGEKGVGGADVVPGNTDVELEVKVMAWLGNQLRPETLFSKDLDIDPFLASTPEAIQAEFNDMQEKAVDKYQGGWAQIYLNRIKNISFGFGGSGFFASQSGERPPWWLNPNITFPAMITIVLAAFITVLSTGSVKEKGERPVRDYDDGTSQAKVFVQPQSTSPFDTFA
jgi:hypothetical protein